MTKCVPVMKEACKGKTSHYLYNITNRPVVMYCRCVKSHVRDVLYIHWHFKIWESIGKAQILDFNLQGLIQ